MGVQIPLGVPTQVVNRSSNMYKISSKIVNAPWIMQMIVPFIILVMIGMAVGPAVESTICLLCE